MRLRITTLALLTAFCSLPLFAQTVSSACLWRPAGRRHPADEGHLEFDNGSVSASAESVWATCPVTFAATALSQEGRISATRSRESKSATSNHSITATLQFHFLRGSTFSPYIGGGVATSLRQPRLRESRTIEGGPVEIRTSSRGRFRPV